MGVKGLHKCKGPCQTHDRGMIATVVPIYREIEPQDNQSASEEVSEGVKNNAPPIYVLS